MMNKIIELLDLTIISVENINELNEEGLLNLIQLRDEVVGYIEEEGRTIFKEEKELISKISMFDPIIVQRMEYLKEEAAQKLRMIKMSQIQKNNYDNSLVAESYFIDRKE